MKCEEHSLILVSSIKDHNNVARLARHILECNEQDCEALIQLSLRQDQLNLFLPPIFCFHFISYPADLRQWFYEARFQLNQEMLPAEVIQHNCFNVFIQFHFSDPVQTALQSTVALAQLK